MAGFSSAPQFGASAMERRDRDNTSTPSRSQRIAKYFLPRPASQSFPYFIQVIIQNPTAVLINHATSVILNACENVRKLSTFTLQIIASS